MTFFGIFAGINVPAQKVQSALKELLLTHGWSKFNWQKILAGQLPQKTYKDPSMITVPGQVFDLKTNTAVAADYPEYFLKTMGYSITKEFYNPDYGNPEFKQPETDNRTTLYWHPSIITNQEAKSIKLKFYKNDFSKQLKVIIEGFDAAGRLIHIEKTVGN